MNREIRLNTIALAALILMIILSALIAKASSLILFIIIFSALKFLIVLFQFVETRKANIVWKLVGFLFVGIYIVGTLVLI